MIGWQLCSNVSYPSPTSGITVPSHGPVHLSLRMLKLDRGLHYYLLEAAYSLHQQVHKDVQISPIRFNQELISLVLFPSVTSELCSKCLTCCGSERLLASHRGLHPPPTGYSTVLHPQRHVSGPGLQLSQSAAEDHSSSENHSYTRLVPEEF